MSAELLDPMASCRTFLHVLRWRSMHQPDRRAFTFLLDGEGEELHVTYEELDQRARTIATLLQREAGAGERALILCPPGLDYIAALFGCLYAAVIAVPAWLPDPANPERTLPRLRAIALDACPTVILTTNSALPIAAKIIGKDAAFATASWLAVDVLMGAEPAEWREPVVHRDTSAFLQYTAGSTVAPKGVIVTHGNLIHNEALVQRACSATAESACVTWLPIHHNMGLIGTILQPVYTGFPSILISPADFLQKPIRWLRAITRYRATISGGPNFAYDLCIEKVTPRQRATLDLRSWTIALNGAEQIRPGTMQSFAAVFGPCGFRREAFFPCYGLSEATWMVTGGPAYTQPTSTRTQKSATLLDETAATATEGAGSGQLHRGQSVRIVDPGTRTSCRPGDIGEIWVAGPSVAAGYWNSPQATEETFRAKLTDAADGPFLRTGDLGFIRNLALFVTGRIGTIDDAVRPPEKAERDGDVAANGEILAALLQAEQAQRLPFLLTYLHQHAASVVSLPPSQVNVDRPFMELGLTSLGMLELKRRVETDLGVAIPLEHFIDYPTITQLSVTVLDALEQGAGGLWAEVTQLTDEEVDARLAQLDVKEQ